MKQKAHRSLNINPALRVFHLFISNETYKSKSSGVLELFESPEKYVSYEQVLKSLKY